MAKKGNKNQAYLENKKRPVYNAAAISKLDDRFDYDFDEDDDYDDEEEPEYVMPVSAPQKGKANNAKTSKKRNTDDLTELGDVNQRMYNDLMAFIDTVDIPDVDLEVQADTVNDRNVYYIVGTFYPGGKPAQRRIATFYDDSENSPLYDAQQLSNLFIVVMSGIELLTSQLKRDDSEKVTETKDDSEAKIQTVRFFVDHLYDMSVDGSLTPDAWQALLSILEIEK